MRVKKTIALLTLVIFLGFVFLIGLISENNLKSDETDELFKLEKRIRRLQRDLESNHDMFNSLATSVAELCKNQSNNTTPKNVWTSPTYLTTEENSTSCPSRPLKPNIQMLEVYERLKFENLDGGAWKQGWDVHYNPERFTKKEKLKVFVVPHSHNDPGWISTFKSYYEKQTKHILNNIIRKVSEHSQRKFIWAEISYLDLWWKEADQESRDKFKQLVKNGQVEIVTGGWVMNDEANTHYYAMIEQLTSGHEWVRQKLGVTPKNGWAIDPFGMSSSMAYLLKRSGLENMVIQRVHYAIKKAFALDRTLEFRWRQNWDTDGQTDMFCHMMPFYSYDVPHTCGPDPKICCQFDFRRMNIPGRRLITCPWGINPQPIVAANVHKKATMLLDQYKKKASLYKTNVLLVQLGDDFRYESEKEFDNQYANYQKLFDYMNSQKDWLVEAKFGTLADYFNELHSSSSMQTFPSLGGDFFTYADIDDHYWSGYFTTRPFYKHLDRTLNHYLRSAEIIYSIAWSHLQRESSLMTGGTNNWMTKMMMMLTDSRHSLGLFQHHDGITGTAKEHVVQDYARLMQKAIQNSQTIIGQCAFFLLHPEQANARPDITEHHFIVNEMFSKPNKLPEKIALKLTDTARRIVLYNSLATEQIQIVTFHLNVYNVEVLNHLSKPVPVQINPTFATPYQISNELFEVSWVATVPALGMTSYTIKQFKGKMEDNIDLRIAKVTVKDSRPVKSVKPFEVERFTQLEPFSLSADQRMTVDFDSDGLLSSITQRDGVKTPVKLSFIRYGTRHAQSMSGAYLFLPDGPASLLKPVNGHHVRVIRGALRSQVTVYMPFVVHQMTINSLPGTDTQALEVDNLVDVTGQTNIEVGMRFQTGIKSGDAFYTDLNGLQMTRRQRWDKLPLQAQYYPMPSMAYIEDKSVRLTVASRQPLGASSLETGNLEILMDRRLNQDDNRGLAQGITDNVIPTMNSFRLLIERRSCQETYGRPDGYPSLASERALHSLLYPINRLISTNSNELHQFFKPSQPNPVPPDVHLVTLRTGTVLPEDGATRPSKTVSLLVHRIGLDCCISPVSNGEFTIGQLFPNYFNYRVKVTSLTANHNGQVFDKSLTLKLKPMEIYAFQLEA